MAKTKWSCWNVAAGIGGAVGLLCAAGLAFPGEASGIEIWTAVGPVYRGGLKLEMKANGSLWTDPTAGKADFGKIGDNLNRYADRTFDDGYVKRDEGTGDPESIDPNVTWNWGYDSASQASGGKLRFHRKSSRVVSEAYAPAAGATISGLDSDTFGGMGAEFQAGAKLFERGMMELHLALGAGGTWGMEGKLEGTTQAGGLAKYRVVDKMTDTYVYDVSGISMPSAPHRGTYDGPFGNPPVIPSPTIPNKPSSATRSGSRSMQVIGVKGGEARNELDIDAEMDLLSAWVGPQLRFRLGEPGRLWLAPQVSFNLADVEATRDETLWRIGGDGQKAALGAWHHSADEQEFLLGLGLSAGAEWQFDGGFFVGAFGRYEWMTDTIDLAVGPSEISIDASSYEAGVLVGYRFGGTAGEPN